MIEALQRFVSTLRRTGVRVSPAEAIDAARAAGVVGVERRELFRAALRACLAKTRQESLLFDRTFNAFFTAPDSRSPGGKRGAGEEPSGAGAKGRHRPASPEAPREPGAGRGRPAAPRAEDRPRGGRLRVILPHGQPAPGRTVSDRKAAAGARGAVTTATPRRTARPAGRRARALPEALPHVRRSGSETPSTLLRRLDLGRRMTAAEEEALAREVPRLLREIRLKAGHRYRRSARGRPWPARIMRESVATGGVPFVIPARRRRPREPRLLVMVDVSWSVMRASSVFLAMSAGFVHAGRRATVLFFVDRCADATSALARRTVTDPGSFAGLLDTIQGLDPKAASDYGRAFYQAARVRRGPGVAGGRNAILVVLGDARSNERDPQAWAFEEIASRFRRVIWLVPEPASRWNTGDSVLSEYAGSCDVLCQASDLEGIARGVAEIVRSL